MRNMFKVKNNTRTTSMMLICCFYYYYFYHFTPCSCVFIVEFEQGNPAGKEN